MSKNRQEIKLPSDHEIADNFVRLLAGMESTLANDAIFANIHHLERKTLEQAIKRALTCAENVRISLR